MNGDAADGRSLADIVNQVMRSPVTSPLPADLHAGDLLLRWPCTGRLSPQYGVDVQHGGPARPLVAVKDGRTRELVRRETIADLFVPARRVYKEPPPMAAVGASRAAVKRFFHGE